MPFVDDFPQGAPLGRAEVAGPPQTSTEGRSVWSTFEGKEGKYRLGLRSMAVPGLPDEMVIGSAKISQAVGPVRTQVVDIQQHPGQRPTFEKKMRHIEVGDGMSLTVCEIPMVVPSQDTIAEMMRVLRDQALAAVGLLSALLDERIAQEQVFEDIIVFNDNGIPLGAVDARRRIRTFQSVNMVMGQHRDAIARLQSVDLSADDPGLAAVRWYLGAVQAGPVPDSIVSLWIALEALTRPATAGKSWDEVRGVEEALRRAIPGIDPKKDIQPTVGRLYGLRADVVHKGMEKPSLLLEGYYALEAIVRLLLRDHFDTGEYAWPARVDEPNLRPEFWSLLGEPRTDWTDNNPDEES